MLPGKPGKPVVHPESIIAVIMWENGDSGNVPFEKFEIQVLSDGKQFFLLFVTKHRSTSWYLKQQMQLSFDACFPSFSLAESPPRDLLITAYK